MAVGILLAVAEGVGVVDTDEITPERFFRSGSITRIHPRREHLIPFHSSLWPRSDTPVLYLRATPRVIWDNGVTGDRPVETLIELP